MLLSEDEDNNTNWKNILEGNRIFFWKIVHSIQKDMIGLHQVWNINIFQDSPQVYVQNFLSIPFDKVPSSYFTPRLLAERTNSIKSVVSSSGDEYRPQLFVVHLRWDDYIVWDNKFIQQTLAILIQTKIFVLISGSKSLVFGSRM